MKLWEKGIKINEQVERFTIGKDRDLDLLIAPFDVLGSLAHSVMLEQSGLLPGNEFRLIQEALKDLYFQIIKNGFTIEENVEDVHSQVEMMLTEKLGEAGKRIHTARSRNDQVLLDIKLFIRAEIRQIATLTLDLFHRFQQQSEKTKDILMPGYTHLQMAMPSSFGLWFGAYAESLVDDMQLLLAAYKISNQNPLGSAAGYGSSFPINRQLTTELLGFDSMNYNVVYAQMGRGKVEKIVAFALSSIASTLSKLAWDICLYTNQNFGFIKLPDAFTTGSSIMPHKKNPDVFELIRARCNKIQNLPGEIGFIANNLPSGYFRDMQVIKESFFPAFDELKNCIAMADLVVGEMIINTDILKDERYKYLFSVEEVNKLVEDGMPFRDAYRKIAEMIQSDGFNPEMAVRHSHEGSIGNLCNDKIRLKMQKIMEDFNFQKIDKAVNTLLHYEKK
ncbi:MAG: argininosuccinate lyase [Bacteroidales bacterium]|nr:argininosuccinate lyase [Bacteroidales bacterium]MBN2761847.1 argininosuccinate lyase [Bacteroidales bacterium]